MAIISFKCPNCDGELIFDPATQKYKCEYCNSLFTQEELDAMKPMQGDARSVRMWTTGNTQYTETKYYAVEREGDVTLRNLTENALKKANVKLTSGVMPYAYDKMKDFHMGYLSGFLAERRDIEQNIVQGKMQHTMRESAEKLMRDTISGYNSVSVKNTFYAQKK